MKAFQLTEKKNFMNLLLRSELFDNFLLAEASIHAAVNYEIDGRLNHSFYSADELESLRLSDLEYLPYGKLRPICFDLIRGHHAPSYFKFVLALSPANLRNTVLASGTSVSPQDIRAAFLNILYQNENLVLATGVSYRTFIADKSFENEWNKYAMHFLKKNKIIFLEI